MTTLVLVRHGEVDGNVNKKFMGHTDEGLNDKGKKQAEALRARLHFDFDVCFVSPLKRTCETFEIYAQESLRVPLACDFLKERNFGIFENLSYSEVRDKYPGEYDALCQDWENYQIPGGESAIAAFARVNQGFEKMLAGHQGKRILMISHAGPIKYILAKTLIGTLSGFWHFDIQHAAYVKLEEQEGFFTLTQLNA